MKKQYCLCSPLLPTSVREIFYEFDIEPINIPPCTRLQKPVCTHPDMLFFKMSDGSLLTEQGYFEENREFFSNLEKLTEIKTSGVTLSEKYPADVAFDALKIENTLFCLEKNTAPEILNNAEKVVNIRQGYAKCSSLVIGSSVITADKSIHTAVTQSGFDALLITPGGIELDGYSCGFIGGASAVIENTKTVVVFGDILYHEYSDNICGFCNNKGYKLRFPGNSYPHDHGGCLFFYT